MLWTIVFRIVGIEVVYLIHVQGVVSGKFSGLQDYIVAKHNAYRTPPHLQWEATNMLEMKWDANMATAAEEWAQQCDYRHNVSDHGQNLYRDSGSGETVDMALIDNCMKLWGDDEKKVDVLKTQPDEQGRVGIGIYDHYSQIIWHDTTGVGCAYAICPTMRYVVCNYSPKGNYEDEGWYTVGPSCSDCPSEYECRNQICSLKSNAQPTPSTASPNSKEIPSSGISASNPKKVPSKPESKKSESISDTQRPTAQDTPLTKEQTSTPSTPSTPRDISPKDISPKDISPKDISPKDISPKDITPKNITPKNITPKNTTPRDTTPRDTTPSDTTPNNSGGVLLVPPVDLLPSNSQKPSVGPQKISARAPGQTPSASSRKSSDAVNQQNRGNTPAIASTVTTRPPDMTTPSNLSTENEPKYKPIAITIPIPIPYPVPYPVAVKVPDALLSQGVASNTTLKDKNNKNDKTNKNSSGATTNEEFPLTATNNED